MEKEVVLNNTKFSLEEQMIIFKAALEQMNIQVFSYDVINKSVYFFPNNAKSILKKFTNEEYALEQLISSDIIDNDYIDVFKSLFANIEKGKKSSEARIRLKGENKDTWHHAVIALVNCSADNDECIRAIGTMQDVSSRIETELKYNRELQYRMALLADSRRVYEINVTKDRFIKIESIQDSTDYGSWDPYTATMNKLREERVFPEDYEVFLQVATKDNLMKGFSAGQSEFYCEYRITGPNNTIVWSSSETHLLEDPMSNDIKGFIYIKDIDDQKKREHELAKLAQTDPLTGIFNRRCGEEMVASMIENAKDDVEYGFLSIDFDDFKYVNDNFGHVKGDYLLRQMAMKVDMIIGDDDLFARIGGDEFILFIANNAQKTRVKRFAEVICNTIMDIEVVAGNGYRPSVSIGIAMYPENGDSFAQLYEASDKAMYYVKKSGKRNIEFYKNILKKKLY